MTSDKQSFLIRACDLFLEVECRRLLSSDVKTVIAPFLDQGKGACKLVLDLDEAEHYDVLNVFNDVQRQKGQLSITLNYGGVGAVSSAIGVLLSLALSSHRGLLLHGSFLLDKGNAHLFLGRSGAGKSTIARNAKELRCIHDDKVAVRRFRGQWWAYGVPLLDNQGKTGPNLVAPVAGIYMIEKGSSLQKRALARKKALEIIAEHVIVPLDDSGIRSSTFETMMDWIADSVIWQLCFRRDSDVSAVI